MRIKGKELRDWILQHCIDENGDLDLMYLDFSDFKGNVDISYMKVAGDLYQDNQEVVGDLSQYNQEVKANLFQGYQKVQGNLYQSNQEVKGKTHE